MLDVREGMCYGEKIKYKIALGKAMIRDQLITLNSYIWKEEIPKIDDVNFYPRKLEKRII